MFAVGAVSGTVLSFELGLLWPGFMAYAGPIIGMPFSLEGFAFFLEAIFLGIYLYGWNRISPVAHWWAGVGVLISGTLSGIFVVSANGWMNTPTGFDMVNGQVTAIRPLEAMLNPAAFPEILHMTVAAFQSVGMLVAGIHAYMLLRDPRNLFHRRALAIALGVGMVFSILQPFVGDHSAKAVAVNQPIKLAALESQWESQPCAPLRIGGIPNEETQTTAFAIEIPCGLSFLAFGDINAPVMGLNEVPKEEWPPIAVTHVAFQIMVGLGMFMMGTSLLGLFLIWRRRGLPDQPWYLWLVAICAPMGMIAIEAGWTVTEVGRQPWIIYNVMRTEEAVTPMPGLVVPFTTFTLLYIILGIAVVVLLQRQVFASPMIQPAHEEEMEKDAYDPA